VREVEIRDEGSGDPFRFNRLGENINNLTKGFRAPLFVCGGNNSNTRSRFKSVIITSLRHLLKGCLDFYGPGR